eukprot:3423759-Rhodomonas_salina.2
MADLASILLSNTDSSNHAKAFSVRPPPSQVSLKHSKGETIATVLSPYIPSARPLPLLGTLARTEACA